MKNLRGTDDTTFYALLALLQGGMWLLNDIEAFLTRYNISHGRFSILLAILESPGKATLPAETAVVLGKSRPTITGMIKKLEADGLIMTETPDADGRKKVLVLTEKGENLLEEIIPAYGKRLDFMGKNLTDREKKHLMNLISKISFFDPEKKIRRIV